MQFAVAVASIVEPKEGDDRFEKFASSQYSIGVHDEKSFTRLRMLNPHNDDPRMRTHWHTELANFELANKEALELKRGKAIAAMQKHDCGAALAPLDTGVFEFNQTLSKKKFKLISKQFPTLFNCLNAWQWAETVEDKPLAGAGGFVTVTTGYLIVIVVEVSLLLSHKWDLSSIDKFFDKVSQSDVHKLPTYGLPAGTTLYVPFGYTFFDRSRLSRHR